MTERQLALEIIYKTISDNSYTNLLMRHKLNEIEPSKRPFVTNLVIGVLKKYDYLLFLLKDYIKSNTSTKNKVILTMALYEKIYLNKASYIFNEYVNLGKNDYDKAFINAVLHNDIKVIKSDNEYINESLPKWLYSLLSKQYNEEELTKILDNYQRIPTIYYRINHHKKLSVKDIDFVNKNIFTSENNLLNSEEFKEGQFYIQDINSASLYENLDLKDDDYLLDVCSAPGGKLFNCLDIVKPSKAYANELHANRLELIKKKASVLGFEGIHYINYDGRDLNKHFKKKFNKIILDVPCSGLGTIGRKPDLKYHIKPENLDELQTIQSELLDNIKDLLEDKGILLYSTCTLNKKENSKQIEKFLANNTNFKLLKEDTIINEFGDCFYFAKLTKE